jgi:hypothetical protein
MAARTEPAARCWTNRPGAGGLCLHVLANHRTEVSRAASAVAATTSPAGRDTRHSETPSAIVATSSGKASCVLGVDDDAQRDGVRLPE